MLYRLYISLFLLTALSLDARVCTRFPLPSNMVISVPVADLRSAPEAVLSHVKLPTSDLTNPLQETQLLLGEQVVAGQEFVDAFGKKWLYVYAQQQDHFSFMLGWHKYRGWIQADQATIVDHIPTYNLVVKKLLVPVLNQQQQVIMTVSIGTRFMGTQHNDLWQVILPSGESAWINDNDVYAISSTIEESEDILRQSIVTTALQFQGSWYSWGGRSAENNEIPISSVDCSGLIGLAFLAHGLQIPRMSNDQYLSSHKIKFGTDLKPGDLVLFDPVHKDRTPHHMTHVMMYIGENQLLEATFADESKIRTISFYERIGKLEQDTMSGDITDTIKVNNDIDDTEYFVYFCSYLTNPKTLQRLRDNARQQTWDPQQLASV